MEKYRRFLVSKSITSCDFHLRHTLVMLQESELTWQFLVRRKKWFLGSFTNIDCLLQDIPHPKHYTKGHRPSTYCVYKWTWYMHTGYIESPHGWMSECVHAYIHMLYKFAPIMYGGAHMWHKLYPTPVDLFSSGISVAHMKREGVPGRWQPRTGPPHWGRGLFKGLVWPQWDQQKQLICQCNSIFTSFQFQRAFWLH